MTLHIRNVQFGQLRTVILLLIIIIIMQIYIAHSVKFLAYNS